MIYCQFNVFLPILTKTFFKIYENIIVRKKTEWSKLVPSLRTWDHAYRRNYCMDISFFEVFFPAGILGLKIKWYNFSDSVKPYWSQYQISSQLVIKNIFLWFSPYFCWCEQNISWRFTFKMDYWVQQVGWMFDSIQFYCCPCRRNNGQFSKVYHDFPEILKVLLLMRGLQRASRPWNSLNPQQVVHRAPYWGKSKNTVIQLLV